MGKLSDYKIGGKSFALALAGGGIRGFAQIPIFEILEKHGFVPSMVSGTSIGSFVAALVAMELSSEEIYTIFGDFEKRFIEDKTFVHPTISAIKPTKNKINGFVDGAPLEKMVDDLFAQYGAEMMNDIKKPLVIVSVDSVSGRLVYFTNVEDLSPGRENTQVVYNAKISEAIRASCAFPGVLNAKEYGDMQLIDGGVRMNLPVEPLRDMGAKRVMSLTMRAKMEEFQSRSAARTLKRAYSIMSAEMLELQIRKSDFNINLDVGEIKAFDIGKGSIIYDRASEIAKKREEDIVAFCTPENKLMRYLHKILRRK